MVAHGVVLLTRLLFAGSLRYLKQCKYVQGNLFPG